MAGCDLPDTLTPEFNTLTPNTRSLLMPAPSAWGRLFPMLIGLEAVDLEKDSLSLGRSESSDITITETKISKRNLGSISKSHFVITRDVNEPFAYIKDLSKNGTFINGTLVGKNKSVILQHEDEISVGWKALKMYKFVNFQTTDHHFMPEELRKKYEVSTTLGEGAAGIVKLVYEKRTLKKYAVKKINKAKESDANSKSMNHPDKIKNEINILKSVSHPCIISVFEVIDTEDSVFIVMEYMEADLSRVIRASNLISEEQVKFYFYQIVLAVQYLHEKGITHRDLKPENILMKCNDINRPVVKLTDFGLSKLIHSRTVMRTACGTPFYVAPEVLDIKVSTYDHQVDIWSLGVILYQMLSQQLPFQAENDLKLAQVVMQGVYQFRGNMWNNVSNEAKDLIKKMLLTDPTARIKINGIISHPWLSPDVKQDVQDLIYEGWGTRSALEESDLSDSSESIGSNPSKRLRLSSSFL